MSYNIDSIDCLVLDARMKVKDIRKLAKQQDKLPEDNFVQDLHELLKDNDGSNDTVDIVRFAWGGEGSGWAFKYLKETVAPLIEGKVHAVLTWEGGDRHSGLVIENGKVIECDVKMVLVPRKKK